MLIIIYIFTFLFFIYKHQCKINFEQILAKNETKNISFEKLNLEVTTPCLQSQEQRSTLNYKKVVSQGSKNVSELISHFDLKPDTFTT